MIVVDVVAVVVAGAFGRGPGRPGARTIIVPERVGYRENTMPSLIIITITAGTTTTLPPDTAMIMESNRIGSDRIGSNRIE